jgi:hypothetical protein
LNIDFGINNGRQDFKIGMGVCVRGGGCMEEMKMREYG